MLTTTLSRLRDAGACKQGLALVISRIPQSWQSDRPGPLSLAFRVDGLGLTGCCWALRAAIEPEAPAIARTFAADCAERVIDLFEDVCPDDTRPRDAITAARRYAADMITADQLRAAGMAAGLAWMDALTRGTQVITDAIAGKTLIGRLPRDLGGAYAAARAAISATFDDYSDAAWLAANEAAEAVKVSELTDRTWQAERAWQTSQLMAAVA